MEAFSGDFHDRSHTFVVVRSEINTLAYAVMHGLWRSATEKSGCAIKGMLTDMVSCIKELLLEGKNVKIADLAIFSLGIKNNCGAVSEEVFTVSKNIKGVRLRARATGELIAKSLNLEATLKKASATSKTSGNGGSNGGGTTPTGGDSNNGGSQNGGSQSGGSGSNTGSGTNGSGSNTGGNSGSQSGTEQLVDAHAVGYNQHSLGVCYEGGLDEHGNATDTRTPRQKRALLRLLRRLKKAHPDARILGHRDLPNVHKDCPCFDCSEYSNL